MKESEPLSTAGFLSLLEKCEENFLVINGDILTTLNLKKLFDLHKKSCALATIAVKNREAKIDFGVVETDAEGFLHGYREKPVFNIFVSMGVYVLLKKCNKLLDGIKAVSMPDFFLKVLKSGQKVYCHKCDCYWLDIGRVDDYEKAQEEFENNRNHFFQ